MNYFRKAYAIRRFTGQILNNGLVHSSYQDFLTELGIQPYNYYEKRAGMLKNAAEGRRSLRYLKAYGLTALRQADQNNGIPGDWLYFKGSWYECKSAVYWQDTPLKHYRTEWVLIGETEPAANLTPPAVQG